MALVLRQKPTIAVSANVIIFVCSDSCNVCDLCILVADAYTALWSAVVAQQPGWLLVHRAAVYLWLLACNLRSNLGASFSMVTVTYRVSIVTQLLSMF